MIVSAVIKEGNRIRHYMVKDDNGKLHQMSKDALIGYIKSGVISNAKIQIYNGNTIIRVKPVDSSKTKSAYTDKIVESIKASHITTGNNIIQKLDKLKVGTPLKIRTYSYDDFEQVIYLGKQEIQNRESYTFFNGSGVTGYFGLTKQFILNNKQVEFKFDDNDTSEVAFLLNYIKKGPFGLSNIL